MAYQLDVNDIVEARIKYRFNGQVLLNVFHYRVKVAGTVDAGVVELGNFADNFNEPANGWVPKWSEGASDECECIGVQTQKIFPQRYPYVERLFNVLGTDAGEALPQNIQLSIQKIGTTATRHGIGRVEVPGATVTKVDKGLITLEGLEWLDELKTFIRAAYTPGGGSTVEMVQVIYNRTTPGDSEELSDARIQDTVRVARRRTVGVGQ